MHFITCISGYKLGSWCLHSAKYGYHEVCNRPKNWLSWGRYGFWLASGQALDTWPTREEFLIAITTSIHVPTVLWDTRIGFPGNAEPLNKVGSLTIVVSDWICQDVAKREELRDSLHCLTPCRGIAVKELNGSELLSCLTCLHTTTFKYLFTRRDN